jgi:DNA-directed RNA polymerase specialized sigma24 family protein
VWASLIRVRAQYQATAKFTTYLYRLAHNRLIDSTAPKAAPIRLPRRRRSRTTTSSPRSRDRAASKPEVPGRVARHRAAHPRALAVAARRAA